MRFDSGILNHCGEVQGYPRVQEWKDSAQLLESLGFTAIWAAEHHFFWDGWTNPVPTNPIQFATYIAAHTSKLRIAQCGVCLPDWHPIRVAEDLAMADHMSGGRIEFGALRGTNNRVNGNFNRNADRRNMAVNQELFWETLEIILLAWKGEPFRFKGKYYELPVPGWFDKSMPPAELDRHYFNEEGELTHLKVLPQPLQQPTPPIWIMAESEGSNAEAARRGLGVLSYAQSFEQLRAAWTAYRHAFQPSGTTPKERLAIMRPIFVAKTQAAAEAVMRPAINSMMQSGPRRNADPINARKLFLAKTEELDDLDRKLDWFDFLVKRQHVHVGTPEYVAERLMRFRDELGCRHFVLHWAIPLVKFDAYESSLKLFSEKVMPKFL